MSEAVRIACMCCEQMTLYGRGEYEICPSCGWEDDPVQAADPDFAGGANILSLNAARKAWAARNHNKP